MSFSSKDMVAMELNRLRTGRFGPIPRHEYEPPAPPRPHTRSHRPHLAELNRALSGYDRHGNYTRYIHELTQILGYTQRNGFADKKLVSPTGAELDITEAHTPGTDAAQTLVILGRRLRLQRRPTRIERDFETFLGADGSWFLVEPRRG